MDTSRTVIVLLVVIVLANAAVVRQAEGEETTPDLTPTTETTPSIVAQGLLVHHGGLCVHPNARLDLCDMNDVNLEFQLTSEGRLKQVATGRCIHVNSVEDDELISLDTCGTDDFWSLTSSGSLKNPGRSDRPYCIHPQGGAGCPQISTRILVFNQCNGKRLSFSFQPLGGAAPALCGKGRNGRAEEFFADFAA